jgi:hypothetical protein
MCRYRVENYLFGYSAITSLWALYDKITFHARATKLAARTCKKMISEFGKNNTQSITKLYKEIENSQANSFPMY